MIYAPDFLVHPGESLAEALEDRHMTQSDLAIRTNLSEKHINQIINGKAPISPETAMKLDTVLNISSEFWNNLQKNYDETFARLEAEKLIENEISIFSQFKNCYTELVKYEEITNIKDTKNRVKQLLSFFGVSSLKLITTTENLAFRISDNKRVDKQTLSGRLRCGTLEFNKEKKNGILNIYDEKKLKLSLNDLRKIVNKDGEFGKQIKKILNDCGVAIYFMPYFSKSFVNGVARWIGNNPMIQISTRVKGHDTLWFTLFHEIGHILYHGKKDEFTDLASTEEHNQNTFIDYDGLDIGSQDIKEKEANVFASNILIPPEGYKSFLNKEDFSISSIRKFADDINMAHGIISRRLANEGKIDWKEANQCRKTIELKKSDK